jgi:hypothetical protein
MKYILLAMLFAAAAFGHGDPYSHIHIADSVGAHDNDSASRENGMSR